MGYVGAKPSAVPLTSADITDNVITSAKIVDGTITNTDIASSIITGQTAETSIDGADSILIYDDSATALRKMTRTNFVAGIGGANTPAFRAFKNTTQSFSNATETKIQFESETFDTASAYDNATNYRFTVPSGQGGKYFVTANFKIQNVNAINNLTISVKKNGSTSFLEVKQGGDAQYPIVSGSGIVELSATDYIEAFLYHEYGSSVDGGTGTSAHFFSAFKIIE